MRPHTLYLYHRRGGEIQEVYEHQGNWLGLCAVFMSVSDFLLYATHMSFLRTLLQTEFLNQDAVQFILTVI